MVCALWKKFARCKRFKRKFWVLPYLVQKFEFEKMRYHINIVKIKSRIKIVGIAKKNLKSNYCLLFFLRIPMKSTQELSQNWIVRCNIKQIQSKGWLLFKIIDEKFRQGFLSFWTKGSFQKLFEIQVSWQYLKSFKQIGFWVFHAIYRLHSKFMVLIECNWERYTILQICL